MTPDLDGDVKNWKILREEHRRTLRRACRGKAGISPLPHYVPDEEKGYGLRATHPNPQFLKPRKEQPLIPGYEPGGDDDS